MSVIHVKDATGATISILGTGAGTDGDPFIPSHASADTLTDGADATQGITTGAAKTTDVNGSNHDYLRGLVKILGDVWDSTNHLLGTAMRRAQASTNVTVAIGTSTTISAAFDARGWAILGLVVPSTFDGTTITFQVSADNATFQALYDTTNTQVSMTIAASRSYDLPPELASWPYWKIICGAAQTTTDTVFVVCAKG